MREIQVTVPLIQGEIKHDSIQHAEMITTRVQRRKGSVEIDHCVMEQL